MQVTIGADPEVFVRDVVKKRFISAHGFVSGTKDNPEPLGEGYVQVDGTALEFNIAPAKDVEGFVSSVYSMLNRLDGIVKGHDRNFIISPVPTAVFDLDYFNNHIPQEAKELGCSPDYDAWRGDINPRPETSEPMRTGSGHIHIGFTPQTLTQKEVEHPAFFYSCCNFVKQLDCALFFPSLLWDDDNKRRNLYGNVGAFRPKPYGVEYRVLSNAWLKDVRLMAWVYKATIHAIELMTKDHVLLFEDGEIVDSLNGAHDQKNALSNYIHLCDEYNFPKLPATYAGGL